MIDHNIARTLSIIKELAQGKTLAIDTWEFGMGEDMSIGPIYKIRGQDRIVSEMTLSAFHKMLTRNEIGMVIPSARKE